MGPCKAQTSVNHIARLFTTMRLGVSEFLIHNFIDMFAYDLDLSEHCRSLLAPPPAGYIRPVIRI